MPDKLDIGNDESAIVSCLMANQRLKDLDFASVSAFRTRELLRQQKEGSIPADEVRSELSKALIGIEVMRQKAGRVIDDVPLRKSEGILREVIEKASRVEMLTEDDISRLKDANVLISRAEDDITRGRARRIFDCLGAVAGA